jgi:hypothetical protein
MKKIFWLVVIFWLLLVLFERLKTATISSQHLLLSVYSVFWGDSKKSSGLLRHEARNAPSSDTHGKVKDRIGEITSLSAGHACCGT